MAKRIGNLYNRKDGVLGLVYSNGKRLLLAQTPGDCPPGYEYEGELYLQEFDGFYRVGFSVGYYAQAIAYRDSRLINDLLWDYRDKLNR